jgi:ribosomal protein S25
MTKAKQKDAFVKVPMWWIAEASKATRSPAALVCVHLLHASWKARKATFPLSNSYLERHGVSRSVKRRVLRNLEAAGLITVERRNGRSPRVTLVVI